MRNGSYTFMGDTKEQIDTANLPKKKNEIRTTYKRNTWGKSNQDEDEDE